MDIFSLAIVLASLFFFVRAKEQRKKVTLLARELSRYQIEKNMEALAQGYHRALNEESAQRRTQIWELQADTEAALNGQFTRFSEHFTKVEEPLARVSTLSISLPFAEKFLPSATFDLRKAFIVHAQGISMAVKNEHGLSPQKRAFRLSAELYLMQHTCHWFCKSKTMASARLMARHQTTYEQVIDAVSPETRRAYLALTGAKKL